MAMTSWKIYRPDQMNNGMEEKNNECKAAAQIVTGIFA